MHSLSGLQQQGIEFELKGGTSLSKGYGLIQRFSEDIDIHIRTNFGFNIEGKEDKTEIKESRKAFYDRLVFIPAILTPHSGHTDPPLLRGLFEDNILKNGQWLFLSVKLFLFAFLSHRFPF